MKKSILQFSVIAAIAASMTLTTSCSSDDSAEVYVPEPVVFNAGMSGLDINRAATRAVSWTTVGDQWTTGIKVKLYTTEANGTTYANKTYVSDATNTATTISATSMKYTKLKAAGTTATDCFYWATASETKKIRAWTYGTSEEPATDIATGGSLNTMDFELAGTDGSAQTNKELLYCYQEYTNGDYSHPEKSLVFKHQLSKVTVKVYAQQAKVEKCTFGSSTTATNTIPVKNTFTQPVDDDDLNHTLGTDGKWDDFGAYVAAKYGYVTPQTEESAGNNTSDFTGDDAALNSKYVKRYQYQAVLLPGNYNGKHLIEIKYDGATYSYIPQADHVLEKGKHYTYTVIVKDAELEVKAAIKPWTDAAPMGAVDAVLQ